MSSYTPALPSVSGGLPTQPDFAPSIVFVVLYGLLLIAVIWRTYQYRRPWLLLFAFVRLTLFVLIRIATFALRAWEAANASVPRNPVPSTQVFIVQQILLGIGFILLLEIAVELVKDHSRRPEVPPGSRLYKFTRLYNGWLLNAVVAVLELSLFGAIALGAVAGSQYADAINDPAKQSSINSLRLISVLITMFISRLLLVVCLILLATYPELGRGRTFYLLVTLGILAVVPAYRLTTTLSPSVSVEVLLETGTRVRFYALQAAEEWLVGALLVAVDVRRWFFAGGEKAQAMLSRTKRNAPALEQAEGEQHQLNAMLLKRSDVA
ncbi:hypothetical protein CALCODRAFT_313612 [Calocera cornea HHB12733]|uniref:Uncharacterized protein n=1 Tax=Calocera cornea HHB12733 TaxID=1353952 RepID=A0A165FE68_9BASI|nr:hypothetical protein CALCODRAFT_313612 [Calocera cornea HHB12733]